MASNRMSRFEIFIGIWNTTGEVLATEGSAATTLSATDTYRWLPGRHFIAHEVDARFGNDPTRSMEVIGYDLVRKKYVTRSYDDQGTSEEFDVDLRARNWRILGGRMRFSGKFDTSGDKLTGMWERKGKSGWRPWINLTLVRG